LLIALGTAVLVAGGGTYAVYHGRSRWWGLLGLLSLGGIIALLCLTVGRGHSRRRGFSVIFAEPYRRDVWRMDVRVMVDASLGDCRTEPIMLQLPRGASVAAAVKALAPIFPSMGREPTDLRFLVNGQVAKATDDMSDGDALMIARRDARVTLPDQILTPPS
jgi:hypothetical protein